MKKNIILLLLLTGFSSVSQAGDFKYLFSLGLEKGGDVFPGTNLKAGDATIYSAGVLIPVWKKTFLKSTIGYRKNWDSNHVSDAEFSAKPIDIIATHFLGRKHQVGLGMTYHISPELSCPSGACNTITFDNSVGYLAEYQWIWGSEGYKSYSDYGSVAVRYTSLEYKGTYSIDASNIGISITGAF